MKRFLILSLLALLAFAVQPPEVNAQGTAVNATAVALQNAADTVIKVYNPSFFGGATSFTVGAYYTTATALDSVCTVEVYHSLIATPLATAGLGKLVSTSALDKTGTSATQYVEETITIPAGISYVNVVIDRASGASGTGAVQVFIKPGPN